MDNNGSKPVAQVTILYSLKDGKLTMSGPIHDRPLMKLILTEAMDFIREMHPLKITENLITPVQGNIPDLTKGPSI